ncbi:kinase-like domain-containing protein [Pisolithus tinctorius]|nr:kinase-like domain-containing protein [Pisolithus tinctorius]
MKYPKVLGVFRAVNVEQHSVAACKLMHIDENTTEKERKTMDKEMQIHLALKHKNVLDSYVPGVYMLLEFAAGGDLFDKIVPDVGVGDEVAHLYFNQLLAGMSYIHGQGVCHRDLKPENLLLDAAGTLKISDFGLSAVYKLTGTGKTRLLSERCGSMPYIAPEPIDAWGIGVILFTLLAGNTPWDEPTERSPEFCRYLSGEIFNEDPWNRLGESALSLICGLLTIEPSNRIPSQLASRGVQALAEQLTQACPTVPDSGRDAIMLSAQSQFTQTLLLFSQTQRGRRILHISRVLCEESPDVLLERIKTGLDSMRLAPDAEGQTHLRVAGRDARKQVFKGWIDLEHYTYDGCPASFCIMRRDVGCPISWRRFWKELIKSPAVWDYENADSYRMSIA